MPNVLIADDESSIRLALRRLLGTFRCVPFEAADGVAAMEVCAETPIDLAILDLTMPRLSGLEVLEALRQSSQYADLPVVVFSGTGDEGAAHAALRLGVTDFLTKPFRLETLRPRLTRVIQALGEAKSAGGPPRPAAGAGGSVLIVDTNAEFRDFARSVLAASYTVREADSGVEALKACDVHRIGAILVGSQIGLISPQLLVRKLRTRPEFAAVPMALVLGDEENRAAIDPTPFDRVLLRSFVPGVFAGQFKALFEGSQHLEVDFAALQVLRGSVATAAQQALGMMAQTDVHVVADAAMARAVGDIVASVALDVMLGVVEVGVELRCPLESARRTAARLMGGTEDAMTDEDCQSTLGELINIVAGRLKSALADHGGSTGFTLPRIRVDDGTEQAGPSVHQVQLVSADGELSFQLYLTSKRSTGALAA